VHALAHLSGGESARRIAPEIDGQRKGYRYRQIADLAERRGDALAVTGRVERLLGTAFLTAP
jgi:hypothetical protein